MNWSRHNPIHMKKLHKKSNLLSKPTMDKKKILYATLTESRQLSTIIQWQRWKIQLCKIQLNPESHTRAFVDYISVQTLGCIILTLPQIKLSLRDVDENSGEADICILFRIPNRINNSSISSSKWFLRNIWAHIGHSENILNKEILMHSYLEQGEPTW